MWPGTTEPQEKETRTNRGLTNCLHRLPGVDLQAEILTVERLSWILVPDLRADLEEQPSVCSGLPAIAVRNCRWGRLEA